MQRYHGFTVTTRIAEDHLNAWRGLLNAHARLTGRIEAELAEAGLPQLAWYDVLWALQRAPGKALRMGELAEAVTISRSGLARLAGRRTGRCGPGPRASERKPCPTRAAGFPEPCRRRGAPVAAAERPGTT